MTITCLQCKYQNPDDAEFCENCGAQLPVPVQSGASPASFSSGPLPTPPVPATQLACPTCRAPLAIGDEFCFNCGTDVRNLTMAPAAGNPPANPNLPDPSAATTVAGPPQMKDEDIDRMLSEISPNPAPASDPAKPATMVGPMGSGNLANPPVPPSNAGPAAPPAMPPAPVVAPPPSPPPAQTGGGSSPVPPAPATGTAGNAFGAPPAPPIQSVSTPTTRGTGTGGALILFVTGPYGDEKVDWKGTEILLGRNDAKTRVFPEVNLDDSAASRRHLSIWLDEIDNRYYAQDLESANGTMLNDRDLKPGEPTILNNGDVLKIGTRYSIKVQIS